MTTEPGYDPQFLPGAGSQVPLPKPRTPWRELTYAHFTIVLSAPRRLAAVTAVNIDGAQLVDLGRDGLDWRLDDRVPPSEQLGDELYRGNDLDRGHLVRRRDPVWGPPDLAARANADTFVYPNAAPQVASFNQSKELWLGLEDYLLGHAQATASRLSVLTGPVLADEDPSYRGARIPLAFWKVAAWSGPRGLAATGYLLDQGDLVRALLGREARRARAEGEPPDELGAFLTYQVPVADLAGLTGLDLGPLPAADRLTAAQATTPSGLRGARRLLTALDQVVL